MAQEQTHRSTEQNREARNKHMHLWLMLTYDKGAINTPWGKTVTSINGIGNTGWLHAEEWNWIMVLTLYTKVNSKWVKDLNVKHETIKCLKENTGKIWEHKHEQTFSVHVFPGKGHKIKNKQVGLHQTENLLYSKGTICRTKRQPTVGENIFINDLSDKGLTSKIYKGLICLNTQNQITGLKYGWRTWRHISPKKKYKRAAVTWKDAPHS